MVKNLKKKYSLHIYVTVATIVGDVENYVTVVLVWIRLNVTFEDRYQLH